MLNQSKHTPIDQIVSNDEPYKMETNHNLSIYDIGNIYI